MKPGDRGSAEQAGLMFFGTIAASVTHELNNVLSSIDQARGLMEDLALGAASGGEIDVARLETIAARIDRQVRRGVEIMGCLNRFAHSLDDPAAAFDAVAETGNLIALARRFADLKRVHVQFTPGEHEVRGAGDAYLFQQGVFTCLQRLLEESEEGDRIEVDVRHDSGAARVSVLGSARLRVDENDPRIRRIADWMRSIGGTCRVRTNETGMTIFELHVPGSGG